MKNALQKWYIRTRPFQASGNAFILYFILVGQETFPKLPDRNYIIIVDRIIFENVTIHRFVFYFTAIFLLSNASKRAFLIAWQPNERNYKTELSMQPNILNTLRKALLLSHSEKPKDERRKREKKNKLFYGKTYIFGSCNLRISATIRLRVSTTDT